MPGTEIQPAEQRIIDKILSRLVPGACRVISISLTCTEEELARRLQKDIGAGLRTPDILERNISRLPPLQRTGYRKKRYYTENHR